MNHRERLRAALRGEAADHPPVALWRHFPEADQGAESFAAAHLEFQERFGFDFIKVTPASAYHADDWGYRASYAPNPEGVRTPIEIPVKEPGDWRRLKMLDVKAGVLGRELRALSLIRKQAGKDLPVIETVFSPLSIARSLAGSSRVVEHLRNDPRSFQSGLEVIAEVTRRFAAECLRAGADGIYFATQMACAGILSREEYARFGRPHDLHVLEAAAGAEVVIVHVHGEGTYVDFFKDYPSGAIHWHDRRTPPSLRDARGILSRCVAGGIDAARFASRKPEEIGAEVREALAQTGGRGHIVAAGCVIPVDSPPENIHAAVAAARGA